MYLTDVNKKINIRFLVLLLCLFDYVLSENPYDEVRSDYPKGCAYMKCKKDEKCVNRKFWCKNPPCPSMLYCSKSRRESLKGPSSCETVRCSKGFICLTYARHCRWNQACEQQIARCISERDYYEGPASCVDFRCPSGYRCILRESLCSKPPCKLLKSCADSRDVRKWLEACKTLGCLSEHECFLRKPDNDCPNSYCKHTPDCAAKNEEELETLEQCRGWICPKGQECSSHTKGPCKREICRIFRSCHKPLMVSIDSTTSSPYHSWRDDIKLSFYSKADENSSMQEKTSVLSHPSTNIIMPEKTEQVYKSPKSESLSRTSGHVVQPTGTSLTTWLNHLRLVTGVDAVEVWIKRADRGESHAEFLEWLESVKDMLGTAAYNLWLEEVRAMTVTNVPFQKWLPPPSTNRTMDTHGLIVETSIPGRSHEDRDIYLNINSSFTHPAKKGEYISPRVNESPSEGLTKPHESSIANVPGLPASLSMLGIAGRPGYYPFNPSIFQKAYQFQPNFGNFLSWMNQDLPNQGFDNTGLLNPMYPQYPANWSFQLPSTDSNFPPLANYWQLFPSVNHQWQSVIDPHENISPDLPVSRRNENPVAMFPSMMEDLVKFYPPNSSNEDEAWYGYPDDSYETLQSPAAKNFGSYPITDRNFVHPSWLGSNYHGQNLESHHRSEHEGVEAGNFGYDARKSGNLYANNNQDGSPVVPNLSRAHQVDFDTSLPLPNRYFTDNVPPRVLHQDHQWTSSYPYDQLYGIPESRPPSFATPDAREYEQRIDPSPGSTPLNVDGGGTRGEFFVGDRVNGLPGQTMELNDLWNSRYRNSASPLLRKIVDEPLEDRDPMKGKPPSLKNSPGIISTLRKMGTPRILPLTYHSFQEKKDSCDNTAKRLRNDGAKKSILFPLLLSLQGYVKSPFKPFLHKSWNVTQNSTIFPVYSIHKESLDKDDSYDYELRDEKEDKNVFREPKYNGRSDFPSNLKNVFGAEAALIMQNQMGEGDVRVQDMRWEYENNDGTNTGDLSNFWNAMQNYVSSTNESSNNDPARGWIVNGSEGWNGRRAETDYYDERVDYSDGKVPEDPSYSDPENINFDSSLSRKEDDPNDYFYDDSDHKRFKKNRPL